MRDPVAFLLCLSLLAIVFPKGSQGYSQEEYEVAKAYITRYFAQLDQNKDDYIDTEEFSTDFKPAYTEYAFKQYDVDGDRKLNFKVVMGV